MEQSCKGQLTGLRDWIFAFQYEDMPFSCNLVVRVDLLKDNQRVFFAQRPVPRSQEDHEAEVGIPRTAPTSPTCKSSLREIECQASDQVPLEFLASEPPQRERVADVKDLAGLNTSSTDNTVTATRALPPKVPYPAPLPVDLRHSQSHKWRTRDHARPTAKSEGLHQQTRSQFRSK